MFLVVIGYAFWFAMTRCEWICDTGRGASKFASQREIRQRWLPDALTLLRLSLVIGILFVIVPAVLVAIASLMITASPVDQCD